MKIYTIPKYEHEKTACQFWNCEYGNKKWKSCKKIIATPQAPFKKKKSPVALDL